MSLLCFPQSFFCSVVLNKQSFLRPFVDSVLKDLVLEFLEE